MLIPLSWLKEFVDVKLPLKDLMWKMTEAGLTCESFEEKEGDTILNVEVTPNRPDWMSVIGIAREVAALQNLPIKLPTIKDIKPKPKLLIKINVDYSLLDRFTAGVVENIKVTESPLWLQTKLKLVGLRPINNIVDITNFLMMETGIPMHAFDYNEILGHEINVQKSKGGETFTSVDELTYILPKNAIIFKDSERIVDLAGIKGGLNSGIKETTTNVLLVATSNNPVLIRRASLVLGLRSDASSRYERGMDKGATPDTLKRGVNLAIELAGGELASQLIDLKKQEFKPWKLTLLLPRLEKVLGIKIPDSDVVKILARLGLNPSKTGQQIVCTVPTYRGDLRIEEDLIEEVARIYGYNKFPKTLPVGTITQNKLPYYFDSKFSLKLKELVVSTGFSEIMTLSLISEGTVSNSELDTKGHIKLSNPVSKEFEYMRTSLIPSLILASKINNQESLSLFELDKVYSGHAGKTLEEYKLSAISRGVAFRDLKGIIELILNRLGIGDFKINFETSLGFWHPFKAATIVAGKNVIGSYGELHPKVLANFSIKEPLLAFELDVATLEKLQSVKVYKPVPEFPAQIEDLTVFFPAKTRIGEIINEIRSSHKFINQVELGDIYNETYQSSGWPNSAYNASAVPSSAYNAPAGPSSAYTFRIWYQSSEKTLENSEIEGIRKIVLQNLQKKFGGRVK